MATHGESNGNDNKKSKTDIFVFLVEPSIDFGPKFAETPNCSRGFQDWCGISHGFPMDDTFNKVSTFEDFHHGESGPSLLEALYGPKDRLRAKRGGWLLLAASETGESCNQQLRSR